MYPFFPWPGWRGKRILQCGEGGIKGRKKDVWWPKNRRLGILLQLGRRDWQGRKDKESVAAWWSKEEQHYRPRVTLQLVTSQERMWEREREVKRERQEGEEERCRCTVQNQTAYSSSHSIPSVPRRVAAPAASSNPTRAASGAWTHCYEERTRKRKERRRRKEEERKQQKRIEPELHTNRHFFLPSQYNSHLITHTNPSLLNPLICERKNIWASE